MQIKVTLIMPVYNAERFLKNTLNYVTNQTLKEIEILIINDGSTDKSGLICDEYALRDQRVTVIHQKNKGMCASRNLGIDMAQGEYIAFADNDDEFDENMLKDNYEMAITHHADMIKFGRKCIWTNSDGEVLGTETRKFPERIMNREEIIGEYFLLQQKDVLTAAWDGMYKTTMLKENKVKFYEHFRYGMEDTIFSREAIQYANTLILNSECYYTHIIRGTYSISTKFNRQALDKFKEACLLEQQVWKNLGIDNREDGEKEQSIAKDYLIPVLYVLGSENCNWSLSQKIEYLKELRTIKSFDMKITPAKYRKIKASNKRRGLIISLFDKKHYRLLLFVGAQYKKIINRRLKKN